MTFLNNLWDNLTILNIMGSRPSYHSEYQGPRQPYHSEYHVQLGTQMTVGDVDFDDANVEDDSIDTVDCLG